MSEKTPDSGNILEKRAGPIPLWALAVFFAGGGVGGGALNFMLPTDKDVSEALADVRHELAEIKVALAEIKAADKANDDARREVRAQLKDHEERIRLLEKRGR